MQWEAESILQPSPQPPCSGGRAGGRLRYPRSGLLFWTRLPTHGLPPQGLLCTVGVDLDPQECSTRRGDVWNREPDFFLSLFTFFSANHK